MKLKLSILLFLSLSVALNSLHAQNKIKQDTIYYLLDTLHTPVNDRMITAKMAGGNYNFLPSIALV